MKKRSISLILLVLIIIPTYLLAKEGDELTQSKISGGVLCIIPLSGLPETMYQRAYGGNVRFERAKEKIALFGDVGYWVGKSTNNLISTIHSGSVGGGLGYPMNIKGLTIVPEIGAGVLIEIVQHKDFGAFNFFDGFGKTSLSISGQIGENQEVFIRGEALLFSGNERLAVEGIILAGMSMRL